MFTHPDRIRQLVAEHHHRMLAEARQRTLRHPHGRRSSMVPDVAVRTSKGRIVMTRTLIYTKITKVVAVAGLVLAACFGLGACGSSQGAANGAGASEQQTNPGQQTAASPAPQPSGMPVCGDLAEIAGDLITLQNGPIDNEPQELQAIGAQLSRVVAGTSPQSSDLSALNQDFNTTVTDSSDGTSLDQTAMLNGTSSMDDDINALTSDCAGF
jgi:hypothetical protein